MEIINDSFRTLKLVVEHCTNLILIGSFNCREVNWDNGEAGGEKNEE